MIDVAVVGGGISGLSVAYRLKAEGIKVKVFEREDQPGGSVRTLKIKGYICELGPQTVLADKEVTEFIKSTGIEPLFASEESKIRYIYKGGKLIPVPINPVSFLTSPLLSLKGKLCVLAEPIARKRTKEEESVAEFVKRRFGEEFLENIVAPFLSGVYAGDPEKLSVKYAVRRIYELEEKFGSVIKGAIKLKALGPRGRLISFKEGFYQFIEHLSQNLDIEFGSPVLNITKKEDRYIITTPKDKYEAKIVVLAVPSYSLAYILRSLYPSVAEEFDKIEYAPLVVVNLGVKKGNIPPGFGFLIPRKESKRILGVIFSSHLFPERSPEDKELLTVYVGGAMDPEAVELEEDELLNIVKGELKEILGIDEIDFYHIKKWRKAIPQYNLGHGRYYELRDDIENNFKGIIITGNFLDGVSMADCIRNSKRIAEKVKALQ